ncbi:MAG: 23S rRNA (guanosine(2251)-2'-O)-methyltransferase RlmB [Arenicellaceae bacterium]|nr:23S rRNA (guanosine(2251)-2'-O)-methyltransferase RlmB [Arenicellaceae bacterium]
MAKNRSQEVVVYGVHAVKGLLDAAPERVLELFVSNEQGDNLSGLLASAQSVGINVQTTTKGHLNDWSGDQLHQGILARVKPASELGERELKDFLKTAMGANGVPVFLALDHVQDPHNLGACIRTAEAAGVDGIIVSKNQTAPLTEVARKVASGAAETLPIYRVANLVRALDQLKKEGVWVLGSSDKADQNIYQSKLQGALCFVMGSEGAGLKSLTALVCDEMISIPMRGSVPSVNVSVATGIVLFEWLRQSGLSSSD